MRMIKKLSEAMSGALIGNKFLSNPSKMSFHIKTWREKINITAQNLHTIKTFLTFKLSLLQEWYYLFLKRASRCQQQLQQTWKHLLFVLFSLTRPNCVRALPKELGHWFYSQNLWLCSRVAFGILCQLTSTGSNVDSNLNSATWQISCKVFICSKVSE